MFSMRNRLFLLLFANGLLLSVSFLQVNSFKVVEHDLEVAGSKKEEEWEKGDESDFFGESEEEKGEKGDKGYESKHG